MKVTNFRKGNYRYCGTGSEVYYGMIQMTETEFKKVCKYLSRCKYDTRYLFEEDVKPKEFFKGGYQLSLRVTATRKIFEKFNLPRYKQQTYIIQVLSK